MSDQFNSLPFRPADILLPQNCDLSLWSVVACDQYTSQPEYWQRVEERVGRAPSALRLILPESSLDGPHVEMDIMDINNTMTRYLRENRFAQLDSAMIYVERTLDDGKVRRGLVGMADLEQYDYEPGSPALIRATEGVVLSRIPPRVAVRKNAPIELPHAMLLCDDPGRTVIEPLTAQKEAMEQVYDFDLMERGGHIAGWRLGKDQLSQVAAALTALAEPTAFRARYAAGSDAPVMLFAVGDGNHSLATAKECYERQKRLTPPEKWAQLPARWALTELVNLHDDSLAFEPIHRVVFQTDPERLLADLVHHFPCSFRGGGSQRRPRPALRLGRRRGFGHRSPSSCRAPGGHPPRFPGLLSDRSSRPGGLHPRRRGGPGICRQAGQHRVPAASHGQGDTVPLRHPRRRAAPQNLLHGRGPRQALLSGGPKNPMIWKVR